MSARSRKSGARLSIHGLIEQFGRAPHEGRRTRTLVTARSLNFSGRQPVGELRQLARERRRDLVDNVGVGRAVSETRGRRVWRARMYRRPIGTGAAYRPI